MLCVMSSVPTSQTDFGTPGAGEPLITRSVMSTMANIVSVFMSKPFLLGVLLLACGTGLPRLAEAQDFKVATTVSQRAAGEKRWQPVGYSVTLFHAGKVYDYMEQVGEVVVFEPLKSRFVIVSFNGNHLATTLEFAELQRFLKVAREKTQAHIATAGTSGSAIDRRRNQALAFQFDPQFEETWDPTTKTLTFISPLCRYEAELEQVDKPLVSQQYLQYADWAARLNYVLHSGALYPEVRLAVNRGLAERKAIPTQVRVLLDGDTPTQMRAAHKFEWRLSSTDKSMVRRCETARTAPETQWVKFQEYQRTLVAATSDR